MWTQSGEREENQLSRVMGDRALKTRGDRQRAFCRPSWWKDWAGNLYTCHGRPPALAGYWQ